MKSLVDSSNLFGRVAAILDRARSEVFRSVNSQMVIAYWMIGREIVEEEQAGDAQAGYGDHLLADLSNRLSEHYGKGYSLTNLKYFRQFYLAYRGRSPQISHAPRDQFNLSFSPSLPDQESAKSSK